MSVSQSNADGFHWVASLFFGEHIIEDLCDYHNDDNTLFRYQYKTYMDALYFRFKLNSLSSSWFGKEASDLLHRKKRNENNSIHVFIRNAFPGFTLIGSAHINIFQSPENETVNPLRPSEIIPVIGGVRNAHTLVFEVAFWLLVFVFVFVLFFYGVSDYFRLMSINVPMVSFTSL